MSRRILTTLLVALIVFPACYLAWFWVWFRLIPADFGMPTYEYELELAFLLGSAAFIAFPLFLSTRICDYLRRRRLLRGLVVDKPKG